MSMAPTNILTRQTSRTFHAKVRHLPGGWAKSKRLRKTWRETIQDRLRLLTQRFPVPSLSYRSGRSQKVSILGPPCHSSKASPTTFRNQKDVASSLGQPDAIANPWLFGLRVLRNRCAHHDRIWNWRFDRTRVKIPQRRKFPEWHSPKLSNNQLGILLTICRYWLNHIYSGNDWTKRVLDLFDSHPTVQTSAMGLPTEWRKHPLWNG